MMAEMVYKVSLMVYGVYTHTHGREKHPGKTLVVYLQFFIEKNYTPPPELLHGFGARTIL